MFSCAVIRASMLSPDASSRNLAVYLHAAASSADDAGENLQ
jgi:hypothetical protein